MIPITQKKVIKIIFCGFGRAAKECLLQLFLHSFIDKEILVFTHRCLGNDDFLELLGNLNIEYSTVNINKIIKKIKSFQPDYLISAYYREIINKEILKIVNFKAMNMHPSLLPDYKGCFSVPWVILNGEKQTGITFHKITGQVDSGNIILQKKIKICENDTAYSLYHKLISLFVLNFNTALRKLCSNKEGIRQDKDKKYRYYRRAVPFGGVLDSKATSYDYAKRFVRAMYFPPFPPAKFIIKGRKIMIKNCQELIKYKDEFINLK